VGGVSEMSPDGFYKLCKLQSLHVDKNRDLIWIKGDPGYHEIKDLLTNGNIGDAENGCLKSRTRPSSVSSTMETLLLSGSKIYSRIYKEKEVPFVHPIDNANVSAEANQIQKADSNHVLA
jgi:hypothetical protein